MSTPSQQKVNSPESREQRLDGHDSVPAGSPQVLVVGAGAVGRFYGAKLARGGARVRLVCRSDHARVRDHGVRFESIDGDFHFTPAAVHGSVAECPAPPDYLLVATKVLPELDTAALIAPAVGPHTTIVLLQNGIEIEEPVAAAYPRNELISGLAFICVSRIAPGVVRHICYGRVTIGRYPAGRSPRVDGLARLLEAGGVPVTVSESVVTERWRKLVWNAPFNPISVLAGGLTTADILALPEGAALVERVMDEVCRVATAAGHPLGREVVEKNLADTYTMKPYRTSMLLDHEGGRAMEVEGILGNAVRAAAREGVAVPHLESLHALLKLLVARHPPGR